MRYPTLKRSGVVAFTFVITILLTAPIAAQTAEVQVLLFDKRTSEQTSFVINVTNLIARKIDSAHGVLLPQINTYSSKRRKLITDSSEITNADEVLFQCRVDDRDFLIVRDEYNSFFGPWNFLAALTGHPVQVSRIVALTVSNRGVVSERELVRRESSYHWAVEVFSEKVAN